MKVTLKEILSLESFKEIEVFAGEQKLNKEVENVYVMEVPDISAYVSEGGLLFTTLYPIAHDKEAMEQFVPNLAKLGLAGVAIKAGRYIDEIPSYMIKQGNDLGIPILKLPSNANFSILTNDILTQLLGMKTRELEFRESISGKLHTLLLSGADIKDLVDYVSVITEMDIVIVSQQLTVIDTSIDRQNSSVIILKEHFAESGARKELPQNDESLIKVDHKSYAKEQLILHPIDAGDKLLGYIILLNNADLKEKQNEYLSVIIEQAVILLAFLLQNRQALLQKERNYLDNFIRDIINQQYESQSDLIQKAKVFKWNYHFPNIIMLLDSKEESPDKRLSSYYKILDSGIITEEMSRHLEVPKENCKVALYESHIICFISVAFITGLYEKLEKVGEVLVRRVRHFGDSRISFSNKYYSSNEIRNAYEEANLVQSIYKDVSSSGEFIKFYKDLGMYKLFHLIEDKESLKLFVEEKLGAVLESDESSDMELVKTLQTLIKHNMNLKKSANSLFIHYNSLRYRVNKLKELGVKLDDGNEVAELAIACQLRTYLNENR